MATPPNPDNPTIRVRLGYLQTDGFKAGNRFFLNFTGSRPSGTELTALATYTATTAFSGALAGNINTEWALNEVDIVDITDDAGASGTWTGTVDCTLTGTAIPAQCAAGVEFDIARRYRGGKPRIYLPPPSTTEQATAASFTSTFANDLATAVGDFIAAIGTEGWSGSGTMDHVLLSYYQGVNTATPPWRGPGFKYPPKYRSVATSFAVNGYAGKTEIQSQKRRRVATTV